MEATLIRRGAPATAIPRDPGPRTPGELGAARREHRRTRAIAQQVLPERAER